MANEPIIRADGIWKRYGLPLGSAVRSAAAALAGREAPDGPWALKDVSFEVRRGETLGIIGRNGAGKSTLLKVLAGVSPPTRGSLQVRGSVFPMIELNAGMHPEFTGRENVELLAAIVGVPRGAIAERMPEIEAFCELGEWFDRPARKYSSGMLARLGFAVAMHVEAEILLVDEVLAVGDLGFQRKCFERLETLKAAGATLFFVTHSTRQAERLCDRVILMDAGRIARVGDPVEVVNAYHDASSAPAAGARPAAPFQGSGEVVIEKIELLDASGRKMNSVPSGAPARLRISYRCSKKIETPVIGIALISSDLVLATAFSNESDPARPDLEGSGAIECAISEFNLLPGGFSIRAKVVDRHGVMIFSCDRVGEFSVTSRGPAESSLSEGGLVRLPVVWQHGGERSQRPN